MGTAQSRQGDKQDSERYDRENCENAYLETRGLPEDLAVTERVEPQEIDPIGQQGAANGDKGDDCRQEDKQVAFAARHLCLLWRVNENRQVRSPLYAS